MGFETLISKAGKNHLPNKPLPRGFNVFGSTGLPQTITRWVQSTVLNSKCPLFKQCAVDKLGNITIEEKNRHKLSEKVLKCRDSNSGLLLCYKTHPRLILMHSDVF